MAWQDELADIVTEAVDTTAFGEAVTLADASVVYGVFDLHPNEVIAPWEDDGATIKLAQQDNPQLILQDADASGLVKGSRLTVRSVAYMIAETPVGDGNGATWIVLMPVLDSDDDDASFTQQWP